LYEDPAAIQFMAAQGIFLVPTLKVGWDILHASASQIPKWIMEKNNILQDNSTLSLKMAYAAGVPIAMGSDVGTPLNLHGENGLEVYWMEQAGMSRMDAIVAATGNAARALGWESWMGTLEADKVADLIVLDSNPLDDLRALAEKEHLQFVMKDGQIAACHAGAQPDLPSELFGEHLLLIK
jgi:imidazolonepropionase-like amidohydrolase